MSPTLEESRRLLLAGQGLAQGKWSLQDMLQQLGFVQLDSINAVARAHELTLHARLANYRHETLFQLLEQKRAFEHWTHDASLLPASSWPYWSERFRQRGQRILQSSWWRERMGPNSQAMIEHVVQHLRRNGPMQSKDFASEHKSAGGWWNWKPEKAALEFLWQSGQISVVARRNFQKFYDLSARFLGEPSGDPPADWVDWACEQALQRLGVATAGELAAYWGMVSPAQAREWCGRRPGVRDCAGRPAVAVDDWRERAASVRIPRKVRLLAPFDPIVRDRARALRLFHFDYRFEAFVPAALRRHGYYSLPILDGAELVGRVTPKMDRKAGRLSVLSVHWENPPSPARLNRYREALERLACFLGASLVLL
ncbi:MAG: crosslink repair DNA glycosylase YcaQ family protein [Vulcanimicrobiota bacterium]